MSHAQVDNACLVQDWLAQAITLHQRGMLSDAEKIYQEILRQQPGHFDVLHLLGQIALQTQRTERGVELIRKAIEFNPFVAAAYSNLGIGLCTLNRFEEAITSLDKAIELKPDYAEAHSNRGVVLNNLRRYEAALANFDKAIALQPNYAQAYNNRGNALRDLRRHEDALVSYDKAIALKPDYSEAHSNRGAALRELRRDMEALVSYDKAIALRPDYAEVHNNRGILLHDLRRYEAALASFDKAIALQPDYAEAHSNRSIALHNLQRYEAALIGSDKAIALKPDYAEAHTNRGVALCDLRRYEEALISLDKAIALRPDSAEAFGNRGGALCELGRYTEARASYDTAIALSPDYADGRWNRSLCLLQLGQLERGWQEYEWRKKRNEPIANRCYRQPLWLGKPDIAGNTLFIHWEQGLGDTLQFCRYAKLVNALGARVVMSVQDPLLRLLKQMEPAIQVIGGEAEPAAFDYHCPLMSLPLAMDTRLETIPSEPRYLAADEQLRAEWAVRLPPKSKPRIGLVWCGRTIPNPDRSMPLAALLPLLHEDAEWISLQQELGEEDAALLRRDGHITFVGDNLKDFSDTAALIEQMDLVITIDTSVAHLAGAMGKPVWILLRHNSDWRWLLDRSDSPWYPTARLFRQREIGNWETVISQVRHALYGMINGGAWT